MQFDSVLLRPVKDVSNIPVYVHQMEQMFLNLPKLLWHGHYHTHRNEPLYLLQNKKYELKHKYSLLIAREKANIPVKQNLLDSMQLYKETKEKQRVESA
jgi:hypothetical protein